MNNLRSGFGAALPPMTLNIIIINVILSLKLGVHDSRLALEVTGPGYARAHLLSLSPLRGVIRDYLMICESYYQAVRAASASQIEAVDMGRRGLHDEGAALLKARLAGKIEVDHETARRLFTLVCALCRR